MKDDFHTEEPNVPPSARTLMRAAGLSALVLAYVALLLLSCAAVSFNVAVGPDLVMVDPDCGFEGAVPYEPSTLERVVFYTAVLFMSGLPTIVISTVLAGVGWRRADGAAQLEMRPVLELETVLADAGVCLAGRTAVPCASAAKRFFIITLPLAGMLIGLAMLVSFVLFLRT